MQVSMAPKPNKTEHKPKQKQDAAATAKKAPHTVHFMPRSKSTQALAPPASTARTGAAQKAVRTGGAQNTARTGAQSLGRTVRRNSGTEHHMPAVTVSSRQPPSALVRSSRSTPNLLLPDGSLPLRAAGANTLLEVLHQPLAHRNIAQTGLCMLQPQFLKELIIGGAQHTQTSCTTCCHPAVSQR